MAIAGVVLYGAYKLFKGVDALNPFNDTQTPKETLYNITSQAPPIFSWAQKAPDEVKETFYNQTPTTINIAPSKPVINEENTQIQRVIIGQGATVSDIVSAINAAGDYAVLRPEVTMSPSEAQNLMLEAQYNFNRDTAPSFGGFLSWAGSRISSFF